MLPVGDTEADVINYLFKHGASYATNMIRDLMIPEDTVYRNLSKMQEKGIILKVTLKEKRKTKGKPIRSEYRLAEKWQRIAEIANNQGF